MLDYKIVSLTVITNLRNGIIKFYLVVKNAVK